MPSVGPEHRRHRTQLAVDKGSMRKAERLSVQTYKAEVSGPPPLLGMVLLALADPGLS